MLFTTSRIGAVCCVLASLLVSTCAPAPESFEEARPTPESTVAPQATAFQTTAPAAVISPTSAATAAVVTTPASTGAAATTPRAPGFIVSGTVTSKASGAAIEGVLVQASSASGGAAGRTDSAGRFVVSLRAGTYRISFSPPAGHVALWWKGANDFSSATDVVVAADVTGIDAALPRGYTIRGAVTRAATGAGLPSAQVSALGYGAGTSPPRGWHGVSDASGNYFITVPKDDPSITYFIVSFSVFAPDSRYLGQFWRGVSLFGGVPAQLTVTGDVTGIDAALEEGFFISGKVTSRSTNAPLQGVLVIPRFRGPVARRLSDATILSVAAATGPSAVTDAAGNYRLLAPRGRFLVEFQPHLQKGYLQQWWRDATTEQAATELAVKSADVGGIDAALAPAP